MRNLSLEIGSSWNCTQKVSVSSIWVPGHTSRKGYLCLRASKSKVHSDLGGGNSTVVLEIYPECFIHIYS